MDFRLPPTTPRLQPRLEDAEMEDGEGASLQTPSQTTDRTTTANTWTSVAAARRAQPLLGVFFFSLPSRLRLRPMGGSASVEEKKDAMSEHEKLKHLKESPIPLVCNEAELEQLGVCVCARARVRACVSGRRKVRACVRGWVWRGCRTWMDGCVPIGCSNTGVVDELCVVTAE